MNDRLKAALDRYMHIIELALEEFEEESETGMMPTEGLVEIGTALTKAYVINQNMLQADAMRAMNRTATKSDTLVGSLRDGKEEN